MIYILSVHEVRLIADLTASALRMEPDLAVVACVQTADAALTWRMKSRCDVILVSVTLPNNGAATITRAVAKMDRSIKVLITGLVEAKAMILRWLEAGATGYVHTDESVAALAQKIRSIAQGECLVSPHSTAALIARISELKQQIIELNSVQMLKPDHLYAKLSVRECEVLDLIEEGYSNQGIGKTLYIELGTVKNHVHNILDKLGVCTRRQAVANATVSINM